MMLYHLHEMQHLALVPARLFAGALAQTMRNPFNLFGATEWGRKIGSAAEIFGQITRRYGRPDWGFDQTIIDGQAVEVSEHVAIRRTYCHLLHFHRDTDRKDPKLLVVRRSRATTRRFCAARSRRCRRTTTSTSPTGRTAAPSP